jgi:hypothetical protein
LYPSPTHIPYSQVHGKHGKIKWNGRARHLGKENKGTEEEKGIYLIWSSAKGDGNDAENI